MCVQFLLSPNFSEFLICRPPKCNLIDLVIYTYLLYVWSKTRYDAFTAADDSRELTH